MPGNPEASLRGHLEKILTSMQTVIADTILRRSEVAGVSKEELGLLKAKLDAIEQLN